MSKMRQLGLFGDNQDCESTPQDHPVAKRARRVCCKEVLRARGCLVSALDRMLREYPNWSVWQIDEHISKVKQVHKARHLHQLPAAISAVRSYTRRVLTSQRSRIDRDIQLAERWYNRGFERTLRELKQAREASQRESGDLLSDPQPDLASESLT